MKLFEIRKNGVPVACGTRRAMDAVGALYYQPRTWLTDPGLPDQPVLDEIGDSTLVRHWDFPNRKEWLGENGELVRSYRVRPLAEFGGKLEFDRFELHAVPEPPTRWVPDAAWYAAEARREYARRFPSDTSDASRWGYDVDGYPQLRGLR